MKQLAAGEEELRKSIEKWLERSGNGHQTPSLQVRKRWRRDRRRHLGNGHLALP